MTKDFFVVYEKGFLPAKTMSIDNLSKIKEVFLVFENENELSHIVLTEEFIIDLPIIIKKMKNFEKPKDEEEEWMYDTIRKMVLCTTPFNFHNINTGEDIIAYGIDTEALVDTLRKAIKYI